MQFGWRSLVAAPGRHLALSYETAYMGPTRLNIVLADLKLLFREAQHLAMGFLDVRCDGNFLLGSDGNFGDRLSSCGIDGNLPEGRSLGFDGAVFN